MTTAKSIMNSKIVTVQPETTVREAVALLLKNEISGLPVVDEDNCLVGIVTEFALMAVAYDAKIHTDPVGDHMTKQVISVDEDATINQVADLCILNRIRRLPVLRDGKLVGLIARRDVLRAACQAGGPICTVAPYETRMAAAAQ